MREKILLIITILALLFIFALAMNYTGMSDVKHPLSYSTGTEATLIVIDETYAGDTIMLYNN